MSLKGNSRESIKVAVRLRPFSKNEQKQGYKKIIEIDQPNSSVYIKNQQNENVQFTYDFAFHEHCTQEEIYELTAAPIVESVLQGINGTIFAYGQTGTGKTYTMDGDLDIESKDRGIVPRAFEHIFDYMMANSESHKFSVSVTYVELYNEQIRDLLAKNTTEKQPLSIHEDPNKGFYIKGVTSQIVTSFDEVVAVQQNGRKNRVTRATLMNEESSRSHSILTLHIETMTEIEGNQHVRSAQLNLVDLAGSERISKTGTDQQGRIEGASINYALLILGNCISALTESKGGHVPYRDSSLTKLLRDSIGGNAKTLMIATLGPADYNFTESISTLRYAERAKKIQNKPRVNMDPKDALLMQYQEELQRLQAQVNGASNTKKAPTEAELKSMEEKLEKQRQKLSEASNIAKEERETLEKKIAEKKKKIEKEKEKQKQFTERLNELKQFLVKGSDELVAQTEKNDQKIAAIREKLRKREEYAKNMQKEIDMKKRKKSEVIEQCKTAEEKVKVVSQKYEHERDEFKSLKAKYSDVQNRIQKDREGLANQRDTLNRQLEFYSLLIDNFIPPNEVERVRSLSAYNGEKQEWEMNEPDKKQILKNVINFEKPNSAIGYSRPTASENHIKNTSEIPVLNLKVTPIQSRLKKGPKFIDTSEIEQEIEESLTDNETDLVVQIPVV